MTKKIVLLISAFSLLMVSEAFARNNHFIAITSANTLPTRWSAYADLYDGKGHHLYHWQETNHKPGDPIHWDYQDGGDKGWLHLWIDAAPGKRFSYLTLPLNANHCYDISGSANSTVNVQVISCP